jgi:LysM repeat protein
MNVQKRKLVIIALFVTGSLLTSCGSRGSQTASPTRVPTVTPLPRIIPPTESLPTSTTTIVRTPIPKQSPTGVAVNKQITAAPTPVIAAACAPPAGWVSYTVQVNDTLSLLAYRTNITVEQIQQANCLSDDLIFAGQTLRLPFIPLPPPTAILISSITPSVEQLPAVTPTATLMPSLTPTVEQSPTAIATSTPTVEQPDAPGPGDPRLSIKPFAGPIGTDYTISIYEFKPGEQVTVSIFPLDTNDVVSSISIVVDQKGNGVVHFVSQQGNPVGIYTVQAHGDAGSSADGNFQIKQVSSPTATLTPSLTPTVEQSPTTTATPTPIVEPLDAPGSGNPRLSIEPFAGPIGTDYTISIYEFKPGEQVTVSIFPLGTNDVVSSISIVVDQKGNGVVHFVSQLGNLVGIYTVQAHGDTGSSADGNLQITE